MLLEAIVSSTTILVVALGGAFFKLTRQIAALQAQMEMITDRLTWLERKP